jgi:hypothetical protein
VLQEGHCFSGRALLFSGHGTRRIDGRHRRKVPRLGFNLETPLGKIGKQEKRHYGEGE